MKFLQHKLTSDIAWSMGSLAVLAASGILINLIIAAFRSASALGAFNQAYAIYILASQLSFDFERSMHGCHFLSHSVLATT